MNVAFNAELLKKADALLWRCRSRRLTIATAESCTGGLVAGLLTAIPGSSDVVERGFVVYSNQAKTDMLGVEADLLNSFGAVSRDCALAMVAGALKYSPAMLAISITGIAGPGGGTVQKPVGLVHFGCGLRGSKPQHLERRYGDLGRDAVRAAAVKDAVALLLDQAV